MIFVVDYKCLISIGKSAAVLLDSYWQHSPNLIQKKTLEDTHRQTLLKNILKGASTGPCRDDQYILIPSIMQCRRGEKRGITLEHNAAYILHNVIVPSWPTASAVVQSTQSQPCSAPCLGAHWQYLHSLLAVWRNQRTHSIQELFGWLIGYLGR